MSPSPTPLPIVPLLPRVLAAARLGPVVVSAPTGSGKSTGVPPTLTALGRVLVVEPRRVACRALASRVAELRGCPMGTDVGWIVRDEHRVSADAAITFVTPGVALRIVQSGDIDAYGVVILDEFHERAFDTDLLLCLLQERQKQPDVPAFALIVMSATIEAERLAQHLGGVHLRGEGRTFPIEVRWLPGETTLPARRGLEDRVVAALLSCAADPGDVLVFLPGKAEIARVAQALEGLAGAHRESRWEIFTLHGGMSMRDQAEVLRPQAEPRTESRGEPRGEGPQRRRVVLTTNVAETSLTIPGVGVVIDSGLVRGTVYRAGRGYLTLLPIARDAAEQRAGRAGRLGPGVCIRLWSQTAPLAAVTLPEIYRESLVSLTLSALACSPRGMDLPWLDRPRSFAVAAAMAELTALGCVRDGAITEAGSRLFSLPLDVGLARVLVEGDLSPGLAEPTLLLAAALSADRPLFRRRDRDGPRSLDDLRAGGCDAVALIDAVRLGDPHRHDLDARALDEARAAAERFRKLGFGDPRWTGAVPRRALAELLLRVWPGSAHVRREHKRQRFSWAAGSTEMELDGESAVRAADTEALIVLASRAVASDQGPGNGLLITAAMPVQLGWLAAAGLGENRISKPEMGEGGLMVTVSQVYAGKVLATREEAPTGEAARLAIRDLALAGRIMKAKGLRAALEERHELVMLAAQVAETGPVLPLPEWLLARLTELGLESGDDLALLSVEDLIPALPPAEVVYELERRFPRRLDTADAKYEIEYRVADRAAIFHQVGGLRKEPPSLAHLPRLPGFRLFWEYKNREVVIGGRG